MNVERARDIARSARVELAIVRPAAALANDDVEPADDSDDVDHVDDHDSNDPVDEVDKCPDVPDPDADDGCPEAAPPTPIGSPPTATGDRDGDGIPDAIDKCPDQPEDFDGFEDIDGCPDYDHDVDPALAPHRGDDPHDGASAAPMTDDVDRCPNAPPDNAGFEDIDSCPD